LKQMYLPVAQRDPALTGKVVEGAAHGYPAGGNGGGDLLLGAADRVEPVRSRQEKPGQPPGDRTKGHVVQLSGQEPHGSGQVSEHGEGQLRVPADLLRDQLPVDGDQFAEGERYSRGDPWELIE